MSQYDKYLASAATWNGWDESRFDSRREALAEVWDQRCESDKRELIALLVAHVPEANISDNNRKT